MMSRAYLALTLHAHLPFVRHPEHEDSLEEDWLFEAITETYIPLLEVFDRLMNDGVRFRVTLSMSPTLVEMLEDPFLSGRYSRHLEKLIELSGKEIARTKPTPEYHKLAVMYNRMFRSTLESYTNRHKGNIVPAFRALQDEGALEIITTAATHAYLPLISINERAVRAQLRIGRERYEKSFGRKPAGIWLPECGYQAQLERRIRDEGFRFFFTDAHGVLYASPRPARGVFAPIETSGMAVFGRDMESSRQVWSSRVGYPGDPVYRDFYRDIGFDLDFDYMSSYIQPTGHRKMTGIKYHRITSGGPEKDVYERDAAESKAREHAADFLDKRARQADRVRSHMDRPPVIVSPYDAELFGHWWSEGPVFLESLFRMADKKGELEFITPSIYLERHPENQASSPASSSWGLRGYSEMWLDESNEWIYRHLHKAADRMTDIARARPDAAGVEKRALAQAARELLLAQSSDWAFIMKSGSMAQYAVERVRRHLADFTLLYEDIVAGGIDEEFLRQLEARDNLFADIDYRVYI